MILINKKIKVDFVHIFLNYFIFLIYWNRKNNLLKAYKMTKF